MASDHLEQAASYDDLAVLRQIVEGTARTLGQEFLQSLVKHLAAGAEQASGAWLLLLHADTVLAPGWAEATAMHMCGWPGHAAYFRFALDSADRRVNRVALSAAGREQVETNRSRRTAWLADRVAELSPEERDRLAAAVDVLEHLTTARPVEARR